MNYFNEFWCDGLERRVLRLWDSHGIAEAISREFVAHGSTCVLEMCSDACKIICGRYAQSALLESQAHR